MTSILRRGLALLSLLLVLPCSWCFQPWSFVPSTRNLRGGSALAADTGSAMRTLQPVLVVDEADELHASFLSHLSKEAKMTIVRIANGRLSAGRVAPNTLYIMGGSDIETLGEWGLQMFCPIYLLSKGHTDSAAAGRDRCFYDLYLEERGEGRSARRLGSLLGALRGPVPSAEDTALDAGMWSHFLSLTFPSIDAALPSLPQLRVGVDAYELRVDLLEDMTPVSIHRQIALLRDNSPLPIVYTVRSIGQIGKFPDDHKRIFALLREGLRAGCEWVDVEACWPDEPTGAFCGMAQGYKQTSRLLGSLHVTTPQGGEQIEALFQRSSVLGFANMLKVVTGAAGDADCDLIHAVGERVVAGTRYALPGGEGGLYIGVCLGKPGSRSRVLNRRFTPVTHPLMATAAPGQLSVEELMQQRTSLGLIAPKDFFLFGTPIKQSLSPAMHNGAYAALHLPHRYALNEQEDVSAYEAAMSSPTFGGASVTIPHKESIIKYLDSVVGAAKEIGAVNTIVVNNGRRIGYNTDWLGIRRPLARQLDKRPAATGKKVGLVIGAGGTAKAACYAVRDLGLDLVLCNRSPDKGADVARLFGGRFVTLADLADSLDPFSIEVVVSTLPLQANFTLPEKLLVNKPVVFDVVYKPVRTPLLVQALDAGCPVVQGASMLLEQGMEQFQLWNRRRAPRAEMEVAVFGGIDRL